MEFRQLEAFVNLAETKNFTQAAENLFLSQSTISSHIKNLETELRTDLVIRSTKTVRLTPEGEQFLFYAKRILETREAAIKAINANPDSYLKLGASTIPSSYLLPSLLPGFRQKYPHTYFDIVQGDSSEICERLADGSIEIGLVGEKPNIPEIKAVPFYRDELVIAAPATPYYIDLKKKNVPIRELLRSPIIMRESGSGTKKSGDRLLEALSVSESDLNIVARNNDLEAIKRLVTGGLGISIFSGLSVADLCDRGQVVTFPVTVPVSRSFYIIYLQGRSQKRVVTEFISFTKGFFN